MITKRIYAAWKAFINWKHEEAKKSIPTTRIVSTPLGLFYVSNHADTRPQLIAAYENMTRSLSSNEEKKMAVASFIKLIGPPPPFLNPMTPPVVGVDYIGISVDGYVHTMLTDTATAMIKIQNEIAKVNPDWPYPNLCMKFSDPPPRQHGVTRI